MSGTWLVDSAGLHLAVAGPAILEDCWPRIAPRVPGAREHLLPAPGRAPDATLPASVTVADARRRVSAAVHAGHLRTGTIAVHGVAMTRLGTAVLLLGGHGAGKSLTGLALAARGWRPAAGDVCLLRAGCAEATSIAGGTRAWIVRRQETARWFPGMELPGSTQEADVSDSLGPWHDPDRDGSARLATIIMVSSCAAGDGQAIRLPSHTAASAVCRASTYLLDKVLDDPAAEPLRLAENPGLCQERIRLARQVAAVGAWRVAGEPPAIAAQAERLAQEHAAGEGSPQ